MDSTETTVRVTLPLAVSIEDTGYGTSCWLWRGPIVRKRYGLVLFGSKMVPAHRAVYISCYGEAPKDHEIHHKCHQTLCVNPDHLQALSKYDHRIIHHPRLTHCKRGHALEGANVYENRGHRQCKVCRDAAALRQKEKYVPKPRPRPTHCKHGHEYTPENTQTDKQGFRQCRTCGTARSKKHQHKKAQASG